MEDFQEPQWRTSSSHNSRLPIATIEDQPQWMTCEKSEPPNQATNPTISTLANFFWKDAASICTLGARVTIFSTLVEQRGLCAVRSERDSEMVRDERVLREPSSSHRSDFGGERKPISNSDQIRSAQKWRLSIPLDSSLRDEAPASNRVKNGRWTLSHAPPEVRRVRSTHPTRARGRRRVSSTRPHAPPRSCPREGLQWRNKRASSREPQEEVKRRGQRRGLKKEVTEVKEEIPADDGRGQNPEVALLSAFIATRRDKKNCPRNKTQDQSSKAATTAMMAVDESDVLKEYSVMFWRKYSVTARGQRLGLPIPRARARGAWGRVEDTRLLPLARVGCVDLTRRTSGGAWESVQRPFLTRFDAGASSRRDESSAHNPLCSLCSQSTIANHTQTQPSPSAHSNKLPQRREDELIRASILDHGSLHLRLLRSHLRLPLTELQKILARWSYTSVEKIVTLAPRVQMEAASFQKKFAKVEIVGLVAWFGGSLFSQVIHCGWSSIVAIGSLELWLLEVFHLKIVTLAPRVQMEAASFQKKFAKVEIVGLVAWVGGSLFSQVIHCG
ncbi:hypothetical protein Acr_00g0039320 [Actinidia rufa]|uniref:Uncharacterized protein n=1 Tax=Actinidia rufa TaxID=165716 RepID=A0A7J0DIM0_9ERIC|nr:hypothetical protein Acr_00g0039320 [Actinidia rufa]